MTPQEKLVAIMQLKAAFFKSIGVKIKYVYKQDIKNLLAMPDKEAYKVVDKMQLYLTENLEDISFHDSLSSLSSFYCPFCVYHLHVIMSGCSGCSYQKLHGTCNRLAVHPKRGKATWAKLQPIYDNIAKRPKIKEFLNILKIIH